MSQTMMPLLVMAIACVGLITIIATKLSRLTNYLARQEAKTNLILKQMGIAFPPPPSAALQALAATKRIAAVKAYREETGLGLKEALTVIDQYRAKPQG